MLHTKCVSTSSSLGTRGSQTFSSSTVGQLLLSIWSLGLGASNLVLRATNAFHKLELMFKSRIPDVQKPCRWATVFTARCIASPHSLQSFTVGPCLTVVSMFDGILIDLPLCILGCDPRLCRRGAPRQASC